MNFARAEFKMTNQAFITHLLSKSLSEQTIGYYMGYCDKFEKILSLIDRSIDQEVVNSFLATYNNVISKAYMKHYLRFLRNADIEIESESGKKKKKLIKRILPIHLEALRNKLYNKNMKWGLIMDLTYHGALRRTEVISIKLTDFNLDEVNNDKEAIRKILIREAKFGKERMIVVPKLLYKALVLYGKANKIAEGGKLFKISKQRWWEVFHDECIKLGYYEIEKNSKTNERKLVSLYHPHSLRHLRSMEWRDQGVDIISIQHRLGHRDISTTRQYINVDDKKEQEKWSKEDTD